MTSKTYLLIFLTMYYQSASSAQSQGVLNECDETNNVDFLIHDIFNLDDPNSIFLHHWANFFHIKTKEITLQNESAFFLSKCQVQSDDIAELERHLRQQKYIREAIVSQDKNDRVKVETWDNWSLMPTVDFGRKGGVNKYSIGIKDRNLFGLGIDSEVEYFSNNQRTGYKFDTSFPLFLNKNITASVRLTSNDDGNSEAIFLNKNFVSFDTKQAYKIGFDNFRQIDSQFQNGLTVAEYNHEKSLKTIQWKWLLSDSNTTTFRYGVGYTTEKHIFTDVILPNFIQTNFIPQDRDYNYPFLLAEYLQKDYRKLTNFNLINQIEDFNLGWHISTLIGRDFSKNHQSPDLIFSLSATKGFQVFNSGYLFIDTKYEGESYSDRIGNDRYLLSFSTEYYQKINDSWGAYFKNINVFSKNQFLDRPVELGDDSGVRGYPLQYQHGERTAQFTAEVRYYPHINIYKLFELGGAAFFDAGKAFGDTQIPNINKSLLTSVGLGARFYSTHSSDAQVIHVDLVKPISTDVNVNGVEIRITTKHSF
tara:strand:- start:15822 stop:17423 length:1602 start_codon:yes stop_codon:yes gene_type:complete